MKHSVVRIIIIKWKLKKYLLEIALCKRKLQNCSSIPKVKSIKHYANGCFNKVHQVCSSKVFFASNKWPIIRAYIILFNDMHLFLIFEYTFFK
jgi:hypothetical protein